MTGVMLGQSMVPALLLTVHGHVRPIGGSGCRDGPPWLPVLPDGFTCPSGNAKVRQGDRALPCFRCRGRERQKSFPTGRRGRTL
jgi:hypothetical protein